VQHFLAGAPLVIIRKPPRRTRHANRTSPVTARGDSRTPAFISISEESSVSMGHWTGPAADETVVVQGTEILPTDSPRMYREKLARIALDSMVQFVAVLDAAGTVLDINQAALDAAGVTLADVEGQPFWTTLWCQTSPHVVEQLRSMLARAAQGERVRWETEICLRAGHRETLTVDASLTPVTGADGKVVFICAEARDSTTLEELELVRTIERIGSSITSELDVHRIVQAVTDEATHLVGAQFGAFFYNLLDERGESYTLYTLSGVPREAFSNFPMPRNTRVFEPTFRGTSIMRSGDITKDERYGKNEPYYGMPKGHLPVRSYLAVPVISHAKEVLGGLFFGHEKTDVFTERHERLVVGVAGWAAVAMDNARLHENQLRAHAQLEQALTEARAARDDAERANLAKSQFLASMSHELRTPLNAIQGHVQLLEMGLHGPLTPEQRETLERVQRSQHALQSLINDVLNFARLEAGRVEYHIEPVDVNAMVTTTLQMAEPLLVAKGLASGGTVPAALRAAADPDKLRQILLNLLSNAIKFTASGGRVAIDAARGDAAEGMVHIRVTDTGRGIPAERLGDIFDPFVQLNRQSSGSAAGIGLGLAISRDLARGMGGDLSVESDAGHGSTFTLTLPSA
jgi:PAS domain S-box-containing protein